VRARLDAIDAELADLDNRPPKFTPEDMARSGVLVSVNREGRMHIEYGFLRPEDVTPAEGAVAKAEQADEDRGGDEDSADAPSSTDHDDESDHDGVKPLPDRLIQDLTAYRTVGLRDALARDFDTAFLAVLHAMCLELFYHYSSDTCLQIKASSHFPVGAAGLADIPAAKAIGERHEQWQAKLPEDPRELWDTLVRFQPHGSLVDLFAHCASITVNTVREPHQPRRDALRHADRLASAIGLDMTAAGWTTTAETYFVRITKAQIIEAVREAKGEDTARLIEPLKKADMAKEAERLLQGTGWLPEPLRTPEASPATPPPSEGAPEASTLPAFLTEGIGLDPESHHASAE
jgi:ParB family chromosome partitioning protein